MKFLIILLLIISTLLAKHDEHKYKQHHLPLDVSYLNLTEEQHHKLVKIVKKFKHERKEFHEEEEDIREDISKLFLSERFDKDEFIRLNTKLKSRSIAIEADFFLQIHKLLSPEQKKGFVRYMKEWEVE
jgi:Spy/CpxP family protein refolding chaperone